jgi:hypothetical protein
LSMAFQRAQSTAATRVIMVGENTNCVDTGQVAVPGLASSSDGHRIIATSDRSSSIFVWRFRDCSHSSLRERFACIRADHGGTERTERHDTRPHGSTLRELAIAEFRHDLELSMLGFLGMLGANHRLKSLLFRSLRPGKKDVRIITPLPPRRAAPNSR